MAEDSNPEAVAIINEMLEQTREAAFTRNFDLFMQWCALPHTITTFETLRTVRTVEEMEAVFEAQCDNFAAMQVTDMVRECKAAKFGSPDRIFSMHVTNLMAGDRRLLAPYPAFMVMDLVENGWRVSKSDYAVAAGSGFELAMRKEPKSLTPQQEDKQ